MRTYTAILLMLITLIGCEKLDTSLDDKAKEDNDVGSAAAISEDTPIYTVADILEGEIAENASDAGGVLSNIWVSGYIVGYVKSTTIATATFAAGTKNSNILLADSPFETESSRCIPVQLSASSSANKTVRSALNLNDHPENLKKKIGVFGNIENYMKTIGMKNATQYAFLPDDFDYAAYEEDLKERNDGEDTPDDNTGENSGEEDDEREEDEGNEEGYTDDSTYNEDEINNLIAEIEEKEVYTVSYVLGPITTLSQISGEFTIPYSKVCGYIVGFTRTNITHTTFAVTVTHRSNIVLADSPDETDYHKCIAVELPQTSSACKKTREALNLVDNPGNLGRCVTISGTIARYMGVYGLKGANNYTWGE